MDQVEWIKSCFLFFLFFGLGFGFLVAAGSSPPGSSSGFALGRRFWFIDQFNQLDRCQGEIGSEP